MKILITGNLGYIGPVLIRHLRKTRHGAWIEGLDPAFFAGALTTRGPWPESALDVQHYADVRDCSPSLFSGVDAVVHLAALSNDPIGKAFEALTEEINQTATLRVARLARDAGVKHFVFASSCSVYGAGSDAPRREQDTLAPLTAYARSKVGSEQALKTLASPSFRVTALRFGTACGMSERLRLDLVINDFVATALAKGSIEVLSDGSPWRPLIHVEDMCRAMDWALDRRVGEDFEVMNTGSDSWNYQIRDLAKAAAAAVGGVGVSINAEAASDKRSYRVDFSHFRELAPEHQPQWTLERAVADLKIGLEAIGFRDAAFREGAFMRLKTLAQLREGGWLDADLRWIRARQSRAPWQGGTA